VVDTSPREHAKREVLLVSIGSTTCGSRVTSPRLAKLELLSPVCTSAGQKMALSRRDNAAKSWRLIAFGRVIGDSVIKLD
jgi:translation initiation factor 2 gamma subunit (eIF-2gamma)